MEIDMRPDELYHYGRLGMKWGKHIFGRDKSISRRNGKYSKNEREPQSVAQKSEPKPAPKPKTYKDMTDEELRKAKDRYELESNYLKARERHKEATNPKSDGQHQKQEKKKSLVNEVFNDAIKPAVINAGKEQLEKYLKKELSKLLKDKPTELDLLKKENEILSLKSKISTNKKVIYNNNEFFRKEKENAEAEAKAKATEKKAQNEVDDYIKKGRESDSVEPTTYSKKGGEIADNVTQTKRPQYLPAVIQKPIYEGMNYTEQALKKHGSESVKRNSNFEFEGKTVTKQILDSHGKVIMNVNIKSKDWWREGSNVNVRSAKVSEGEKAAKRILDKYGRTMVHLNGNSKEWWE